MAHVKLLEPSDPRKRLDRYEVVGELASGGMATVYLARLTGVGGFQRFVAIKLLHPHLASEPEFIEMFLDEARLSASIHHPHVVPILEVGTSDAGYYLVMEYVEGDTLGRLIARAASAVPAAPASAPALRPGPGVQGAEANAVAAVLAPGPTIPRSIALRIVLDALAGLHAAHELIDESGQAMGLVHRDCSPQNILVGIDGSARLTDFGVARAASRLSVTRAGKLKGKLAYMSPEQVKGLPLDRRADLFAMGIILWEVLAGRRLFKADTEAATLARVLIEPIPRLSSVARAAPSSFDAVCARALERDPAARFQTAAQMADAIERAAREAAAAAPAERPPASPRDVAAYVERAIGQDIAVQRESVRAWLALSEPSVSANSRPRWDVTVKMPMGGDAAVPAASSAVAALAGVARMPPVPPAPKTQQGMGSPMLHPGRLGQRPGGTHQGLAPVPAGVLGTGLEPGDDDDADLDAVTTAKIDVDMADDLDAVTSVVVPSVTEEGDSTIRMRPDGGARADRPATPEPRALVATRQPPASAAPKPPASTASTAGRPRPREPVPPPRPLPPLEPVPLPRPLPPPEPVPRREPGDRASATPAPPALAAPVSPGALPPLPTPPSVAIDVHEDRTAPNRHALRRPWVPVVATSLVTVAVAAGFIVWARDRAELSPLVTGTDEPAVAAEAEAEAEAPAAASAEPSGAVANEETPPAATAGATESATAPAAAPTALASSEAQSAAPPAPAEGATPPEANAPAEREKTAKGKGKGKGTKSQGGGGKGRRGSGAPAAAPNEPGGKKGEAAEAPEGAPRLPPDELTNPYR